MLAAGLELERQRDDCCNAHKALAKDRPATAFEWGAERLDSRAYRAVTTRTQPALEPVAIPSTSRLQSVERLPGLTPDVDDLYQAHYSRPEALPLYRKSFFKLKDP